MLTSSIVRKYGVFLLTRKIAVPAAVLVNGIKRIRLAPEIISRGDSAQAEEYFSFYENSARESLAPWIKEKPSFSNNGAIPLAPASGITQERLG